MFIASVQKSMPGVEIFHLTNETCPAVDGAKAMRLPDKMPMGIRRLAHYASLSGDWLLCDSDVIVQRDVSDVFDSNIDIAVATRKGTVLEGSDYERAFPYNFGVIFSRSPEFWKEALGLLKKAPPELQEWEGEQHVLGHLVNSGRYRTSVLSASYNWTPQSKGEDVSDKHIVHYKGPRKKWLLG